MTDAHRQRLALSPPAFKLGPLFSLVREWACRARSRREIAKLDERTICDLGLSRSQLEFEAHKPFWRK